MQPKKIKRHENDALEFLWDDGAVTIIPFIALRDACPCAGCKGETIMFTHYEAPVQPELPGKYNLRTIEPVGHYALQLSWGDGHNTGIYTWEQLRSIANGVDTKT